MSRRGWALGAVAALVVLVARRIGKTQVIQDSGTHRAQQTTGTENARAWLEVPYRFVAEVKKKK